MVKQRHTRSKKGLKKILLVGTLIGLLFLHFYVPRVIVEIQNPLIQLLRGKPTSSLKPRFSGNTQDGKYLTLESHDKFPLSAYLTYSKQDTSRGLIILLHGIRSYKEHFITLADNLAQKGYSSVALDLRAHGQSGGKYCTYGVEEKKDISTLIDTLEAQGLLKGKIGLWGQSLGGAIGLQAVATDSRISYAIIESTFADFETIAHDYFKQYFNFGIRPLTNYLVYRAGEIAGFDPQDANPFRYCQRIKQPILLVHGNKDNKIDISYGRKNYQALSLSKGKAFIEVENASHINVWKRGGEDYFEKVWRFIISQN